MAESTAQTAKRRLRKTRIGVVTSAHKTPKTIRVEVQYSTRHRKYLKYLRRRTRLHAHDEKSEAQLGDLVQVMECRPVSKTKVWRLVKVIQRSPEA